jgi:hypothetical protein
VTEGLCNADDPTTCVPDPDASNTSSTTYTSQTSGTCLGPITGTLGSTAGAFAGAIAPNSPSGTCFVSMPTTFTLSLEFELSGTVEQLNVDLQSAQIAGQWSGDPATAITTGLLRGFLRMQDADQQNLTINVDNVGDVNINLGRDILPDGGNAHGCGGVARTFPGGITAGNNTHQTGVHRQASCSNAGDARDLFNPGAGASYQNCGWWFYVNYTGVWASNASGF